MLKNVKPKYTAREAEAKNWVYDLIKGDNQFVFVAEVPGPDDKIMVRLIDSVLYVRGSGGPYSMNTPHTGNSRYEEGIRKIPHSLQIEIGRASCRERV